MQELGGRVQRGSGSGRHNKGDGRLVGKARVECKFTTSLEYKLPMRALQKIRSECTLGEKPVLVVEFKEPHTLKTRDTWAVIPWDEYKEYLDATADDS